jgi:murein DD-endopeptidase MepM/ murein hydrolase activator NlpD
VKVAVPPGEVLNVRPDASTAGEPVGSLPNNAIVDVLEIVQGQTVEGNDTWYRVAYVDLEGYVSGAFALCTLEEQPELLPPDAFYLPMECGTTTVVTQGNNGTTSHMGISAYAFDFALGLNTPFVAMADGIVAFVYADTVPGDPCYDGGGSECNPYTNLVSLLHGDGTRTIYKHLNEVHVAIGELVPRGSPVGLSGSTGWSTGRHAHVARMENCENATCQSVPLAFADFPGDGVPVTGDAVTSGNCP